MEDDDWKVLKDDGWDPKRIGRRRLKKSLCQYCGNMVRYVRHGKDLFCEKCHQRMPWTVAEDRSNIPASEERFE